jgi:hypothetical protein
VPIDQDYAAERLTRIENLLTEAKAIKAGLTCADTIPIRQLADKLDNMLKELRGGDRRVSPKRSGPSGRLLEFVHLAEANKTGSYQ